MVHYAAMATQPQFKLRFEPELKAQIEDAATRNGQSINAEINQRLELSFESDRRLLHMNEALDAKEKLLSAQARMLSITAFYLSEVVQRVPVSENAQSNVLMTHIRNFSTHLAQGNIAEAMEPIASIAQLSHTLDEATLAKAKKQVKKAMTPAQESKETRSLRNEVFALKLGLEESAQQEKDLVTTYEARIKKLEDELSKKGIKKSL